MSGSASPKAVLNRISRGTDANQSASADNEKSPVQPSLIQQRMRLDRERVWGLWTLCGGAVLGTLQVVNLRVADPASVWVWLALLGWTGIAAAGVFRFLKARRARARFEAEHGKDAGRQQSLR